MTFQTMLSAGKPSVWKCIKAIKKDTTLQIAELVQMQAGAWWAGQTGGAKVRCSST